MLTVTNSFYLVVAGLLGLALCAVLGASSMYRAFKDADFDNLFKRHMLVMGGSAVSAVVTAIGGVALLIALLRGG